MTKAAGVLNPGGRAMSAVAADLNNDGWMDVYVANDSMENYYYENKRDGTFEEKAHACSGWPSGRTARASPRWARRSRTSTATGTSTSWSPTWTTAACTRSRAASTWTCSGHSGLAVICGQYTGWGAVVHDFDNDGYTDVFISNGDSHHEYAEDAVLARNDGKGRFVDVARGSGDFFQTKWSSRGATWADFDDDGNVDVLVVDTSGPPHLLRNGGGTGNHWLKVDARTKGGTRTAIGARVTVTAGGRDAVPGRDRRERLPLAGRHARPLRARQRPRRPTSCRSAGPTARRTSGRT